MSESGEVFRAGDDFQVYSKNPHGDTECKPRREPHCVLLSGNDCVKSHLARVVHELRQARPAVIVVVREAPSGGDFRPQRSERVLERQRIPDAGQGRNFPPFELCWLDRVVRRVCHKSRWLMNALHKWRPCVQRPQPLPELRQVLRLVDTGEHHHVRANETAGWFPEKAARELADVVSTYLEK